MIGVEDTKRSPGKANPNEVRGFQRAFKTVQVDGKVGDQTWGQVLLLWNAYDKALARIRDLETRPQAKCNLWKWVVASVTAFVTWALGGFEQIGAWITAALH